MTIPTDNPSIMVAKVREFDFDKVSVQIDKLIKMADLGKTFLAVSTMKEIVPEFKSNNSPFEELDIKEEGK